MIVPYRVSGFHTNEGRFPSGSVIALIGHQGFFQHVSKHLDPRLDPVQRFAVRSLHEWDYSTSLVFNFPPPRLNTYSTNNFDVLLERSTKFASDLRFLLGFNQVEIELPIFQYIRTTRFFPLFLSLIINVITAILTLLSIILIYSLLMVCKMSFVLKKKYTCRGKGNDAIFSPLN